MGERAANERQPSRLRPGDSASCPRYHAALDIIGRRWAGAIVRALLAGETRFNDIAAAWPAMSHRVLSQRLKELEEEGIVRRVVHDETPVRIEYRLTDKGEALSDVVAELSRWADTWLPEHAPN
ncbi:winged helix-turn-helix transcriptional regulator [Haloactinospora alba]|nr:helix-turn-helix domain-containing protein [Haloactinospora alba]